MRYLTPTSRKAVAFLYPVALDFSLRPRRLQTNHTKFYSCTDSLVVKDPISDAGGPRFESHAGRVTGKPTPSLWRDKHPAIKGLRPPEHHAGKFRQDQKDSSESKKEI